MTVAVALRIVARRWYVMLAVLLVSAGGFYWRLQSAGVYTAHALVEFIPPDGAQVTAAPDYYNEQVTNFAGSVVAQYNSGREVEPLSSSSAPLYGVGIRQGTQVSLSNDGNQWMSVFSSPVADVQVVGPTAAWVHSHETAIISRLRNTAAQSQSGVAADERITIELQPLSDSIAHIYPGRNTTRVAAAAFGVAGILVGATLCVWCDAAVSALGPARARTRPAPFLAPPRPLPRRT